MIIVWRRCDFPRDIPIELDDNIPVRILSQLFKRLVGGPYDAVHQPPRGRRVILYNEDARTLEQPPNPEVTGWAAQAIHGDAVIIEPDVFRKVHRT